MGDSFSVWARHCTRAGCGAPVVFIVDAASVQAVPGERSRAECPTCGWINVLYCTDTRSMTNTNVSLGPTAGAEPWAP